MRTLEEIKNKIYNQFHSKLNPLENTPKYDLVKIISDVEAGIYFSLLGDIEFLKKQILQTFRLSFLKDIFLQTSILTLHSEIAVIQICMLIKKTTHIS